MKIFLTLLLLSSFAQASEKKSVAKKMSPPPVTLPVQKKNSPPEIFDAAKACALAAYAKQIDTYKKTDRYLDDTEAFQVDEVPACKDANLSFDSVSKTEFKLRASSKESIWTIDQTKSLIKER